MNPRLFSALLCAMLVWAGSVSAQEMAAPKVVASYFQCDWSIAQPYLASVDSLEKPMWQEMVDDGKLLGWGVMAHDFAGYENVIVWYMAESLQQVEDAIAEFTPKFAAAHPDAPTACTNHRDAIYTLGANTGPNPPEYDNMVVSYFMCENDKRDQIAASIDSLMLPVAQELVDEGVFGNWGILVHDWAGRENIINFRTAKTRSSFFEGWQEMGRRMAERHPDADPFMGCNQHRDGLYNDVTRTSPPPGMEGESGMGMGEE